MTSLPPPACLPKLPPALCSECGGRGRSRSADAEHTTGRHPPHRCSRGISSCGRCSWRGTSSVCCRRCSGRRMRWARRCSVRLDLQLNTLEHSGQVHPWCGLRCSASREVWGKVRPHWWLPWAFPWTLALCRWSASFLLNPRPHASHKVLPCKGQGSLNTHITHQQHHSLHKKHVVIIFS